MVKKCFFLSTFRVEKGPFNIYINYFLEARVEICKNNSLVFWEYLKTRKNSSEISRSLVGLNVVLARKSIKVRVKL